MKSLRFSPRVSFLRSSSRCTVSFGRPFSISPLVSSSRSIEVPTSQTTKEQTSIPTISTCPAPTCTCGETPTDLDIDRTKSLKGLMPRYTRHIVIRTGQDDWDSRIEDGTIGGGKAGSEKGLNLARELKDLIGPKGKYHHQDATFLITNSSFDSFSRFRGRSVSIYPEGYTVSDVGETSETLEDFIKQFLISSSNSDEMKTPVPDFRVREADNEPTVLICGHNSRDQRCGVMGPLLRKEFLAWIYRQRTKYHQQRVQSPETTISDAELGSTQQEQQSKKSVSFIFSRKDWEKMNCSMKVGLISHIGGHAWAGNVIIYLPPQHCLADGSLSPLAGKGVWYGRVEPRHVEGIMEETVRKGRVIEELLRGIHDPGDVT